MKFKKKGKDMKNALFPYILNKTNVEVSFRYD